MPVRPGRNGPSVGYAPASARLLRRYACTPPSRVPPIDEVQDLGATLDHRDQVLAARLGPAHRTAGLMASRHTSTSSTFMAFAPKPPADVGRDDAHRSGSRPNIAASAVTILVRRLGGEPRREPPVVAHRARCVRGSSGLAAMRWLTTVPETTASQPSNRVLASLPAGCAGTRSCRLSEQQDLVLDRLPGIGDDGKLLVVDVDEVGRVGALLLSLGEDRGDDVADEAHGVGREQRTRHALVDAHERRSRVVGSRCRAAVNTCTPGIAPRGGRVDPRDPRVRAGDRTSVRKSSPSRRTLST